MQTKLFEVRDRMTMIDVMAIGYATDDVASTRVPDRERRMLWRAGYGPEGGPYVILFKLAGGRSPATCDPFDWNDRTMRAAHQHMIENWNALESGQVVDVEFILGETAGPKRPE